MQGVLDANTKTLFRLFSRRLQTDLTFPGLYFSTICFLLSRVDITLLAPPSVKSNIQNHRKYPKYLDFISCMDTVFIRL